MFNLSAEIVPKETRVLLHVLTSDKEMCAANRADIAAGATTGLRLVTWHRMPFSEPLCGAVSAGGRAPSSSSVCCMQSRPAPVESDKAGRRRNIVEAARRTTRRLGRIPAIRLEGVVVAQIALRCCCWAEAGAAREGVDLM